MCAEADRLLLHADLGAQRLSNGNTLICSGINGTLFEVTPDKETVWKYVNPTKGGPMGGIMAFGPPQLGQIMPGFLQGMLNLTDEQKKDVEAFQKELGGRLEKLLTDEQKKQFREPRGFGPGGFGGGPPKFGEVLPKSQVERLKLTEEQKKKLDAEQKEVEAKLDKLLTDAQKKQIKEMEKASLPSVHRPATGYVPGPGGPADLPGRSGAPPGGPWFRPPGGPQHVRRSAGGTSVFRSPLWAGVCWPAGRDLKPGKTVESCNRRTRRGMPPTTVVPRHKNITGCGRGFWYGVPVLSTRKPDTDRRRHSASRTQKR
jgi:hypothetical protein